VAACRGERAKQRQQGVARPAGRGAVGQELEDVDQTGHQALLGLQDEAAGRAVLARQAVLRKAQVFAAKLVRLAWLRPGAPLAAELRMQKEPSVEPVSARQAALRLVQRKPERTPRARAVVRLTVLPALLARRALPQMERQRLEQLRRVQEE
jgi:hypothetical protein